jgi:signal transduction histidine kinase
MITPVETHIVRVLLIEDNEDHADLVQLALEDATDVPPELTWASSLSSGLRHLEGLPFDVVLLDLDLPGSSGLATLHRVRSAALEVPIVVLTGIDEDTVGERAVREGAQDFLTKATLSSATLFRSVRYAIGRNTQLRELRRQNRDLDEFARVAAHDLRSPLNAIAGACQLLRDSLGPKRPPDSEEYLAVIERCSRRMWALVSELLSLSQVGTLHHALETIDLDGCVDDALLVLRPNIQGRGARIIRDPLPEVMGNEVLLTQLFQNLIGNALQYVRGQAPVIHITHEVVDGRSVHGVADNGRGVDPQDRERIFDSFTRLEVGRGHGVGLGLATCKKVVELHGGEIWVASEPGGGAHFKFTLNAGSPPSSPATLPPPRGEREASAPAGDAQT